MAQRSKSSYKGYKDSQLPTNGSGSITAAAVRLLHEDLADSVVFIEDGVNTDVRYFEQEDWVAVASSTIVGRMAKTASGTGSGASVIGDNTAGENALGILYLTTGTTTTGYAAVYSSLSAYQTGYHKIKLRFRLRLSPLSDGTDTYTAYVGFGDNITTGDNADGCYFRYTHSVNSGKWEAVNAGASSRTAVDTGVTAATTYSIFEIEINEAASSVSFTIDGTVVANTTDIPTGSSETFGMVYKIEKSAGTSDATIYQDWYDLLITRSTAR